jgi:hypothetical protein
MPADDDADSIGALQLKLFHRFRENMRRKYLHEMWKMGSIRERNQRSLHRTFLSAMVSQESSFNCIDEDVCVGQSSETEESMFKIFLALHCNSRIMCVNKKVVKAVPVPSHPLRALIPGWQMFATFFS